jgi:Fur family transcriptional regulator, stress-responsive regulator
MVLAPRRTAARVARRHSAIAPGTGRPDRYDSAMQPVAEDLAEQLRDHGLRATTTRVAVLRAVGELSGHPDTDTIATRVRQTLGTISTQAVYDGLHAMTRVGLLRRIEPAGSPARYETRVGDNHHHVVCRSCGAAHDVDCVVGSAPCLTPSSEVSGFVIDEAEVTFWGICPECQAADAAASGSAAAR